MATDQLALKWGDLKRWEFNSDAAQEAYQQYIFCDPNNREERKRALCDIIWAIDSACVYLDFYDKWVTKDEAVEYVMGYE